MPKNLTAEADSAAAEVHFVADEQTKNRLCRGDMVVVEVVLKREDTRMTVSFTVQSIAMGFLHGNMDALRTHNLITQLAHNKRL